MSDKITVGVTGAAGYIAGRLIESLVADDRVDRIVGFDVAEPARLPDKVVFDSLDVRDPALEARLAGVDVVVHLAFVMDPIQDEALMRDINVNGSQNVFRCAAQAGVRKVIYTSSAVVYGAHPDNDFPLTESSPLRANLDFSYPAHKLEVEYVVREIREEFPELGFIVFRPAIVFGPHADNAWTHLMEVPLSLGIRGYAPSLQFVHEDDVAGALAFGVFNELDGPYNLAPKDWVGWDEAATIVGRRRHDLNEPRAFAVMEKMWELGLSEAPAGMLHYVMHPWVVSPERLAEAGFECRVSARSAFEEVALRSRDFVRLGKFRLKRELVGRAAFAGAGLVGAYAALRGMRRLAG